MNMKNTAILLIFLLAVVGLIIGVYYTEADDIEKTTQNSDEMIYEDSDGAFTITLEKNEKDESFVDRYLRWNIYKSIFN